MSAAAPLHEPGAVDGQAARQALRVAVVSETWPPEVNGVAATAARVLAELRGRGHALQLLRPRQHPGDTAAQEPGFDEVLVPGLPVPRYPQLRMGLPSFALLRRLWALQRPDVVHLVTEGPLGWGALRAARSLGLPVVSDFRTNFHVYSRHYGAAWLQRPIAGYLRRFHNRTACTMVPTEALRAELQAQGFENLRVVARGVDTRQFDPAHRSDELRRHWGAGPGDLVAVHVGRIAPEKNLETLLAATAATLDVALHHHERIDGTGYPHRLPGEAIDRLSRMGAICDVYDAITSNRPYKAGWDPASSIARMAGWKGHFDPALFAAFVQSLGIFPTGSLVRLESQRIAVVAEQNDAALTAPVVVAFYSLRSGMPIAPQRLDLSRPGTQDRIVGREEVPPGHYGKVDELWAAPEALRAMRG